MKKLFIAFMFVMTMFTTVSQAQEFMQMTTIESVVAGGLGRSRMIIAKGNNTDNFEEIKMKNFFSMVGINFGNIRKNDKLITDKITEYTKDGWKLIFITPGVYAGGADDSSNGIFITRYLFRKD